MRRPVGFALGLAASLVGASSLVAARSPEPARLEWLVVQARYVDESDPALKFEVRSKLADAFNIYKADLPWGNVACLELTFRDASEREVCPVRTSAIDDPSDTEITVKPGEVLRGSVKLEVYCPQVKQLLRNGSMTVEWVYKPVSWRTTEEPLRGRVSIDASQ